MKQTNWMCDCEMRVPITLSGNTDDLTDYQVKLEIPSLSGINADYSNVKFTSDDQVSEIDHWTQTSNSSNGIAWVEVPNVPAGGTTIYMYYGNCGSSGNAADVFEYFNDFDSDAGIMDYNRGEFSTETYQGMTVLRKEGECDPNGAQIPLGFNIDDFVLITREARPGDGTSNGGCGLNRYGVENSDFDGYNIIRNGHSGSYFGVERRDNARGGNNSRVNLNPRTPQDEFMISELRRCCAANQNQGEFFNSSGESVAIVNHSVASHNYCNFDRLTIRGGIDFLVDYMALAKNSCNPPVASFGIPEIDGPEALCQDISVPLSMTGTASISPMDIDNGSSDNCDSDLDPVLSNNSWSCTDLGSQVTVLTVTDDQGHTSTCVSTITVVDNSIPNISCPTTAIMAADPGLCSKNNITLLNPTTDDNCGVSSVSNNLSSSLAVGNHSITWTVTDNSGNTNTCSQTVIVIDDAPPVLACPSAVSVATGAGTCDTVGLSLSGLSATDACGVMNTINDAPNSYPVGTTIVTWTATDVNGNTSSCQQNIIVTDSDPPSITCGGTVTLNANANCESDIFQLTQPAAVDNCDIDDVTSNAPVPPMAYPIGSTTVTWEVTDDNGNVATCIQTIIVIDEVKPVVECPAPITVDTDLGSCVATGVTLPMPNITENCTVSSTSNDAPTSFPLGSSSFIWTVTDDAGNTGTCNQTVLVNDNENPIITCPAPVNINTDLGKCEASSVNLGTPTTGDNCMVLSVSSDNPTTNFPTGTTSVTWTVTDNTGNTASCSQIITINDDEIPSMSCETSVKGAADFGACTSSNVNLASPIVNDACGINSITNDAPASFPLGLTNVIWTALDVNGNMSTCQVSVDIVDVEAPQLVCPPDTFVSCGESVDPTLLGFPTANDMCSTNLSTSRIDSVLMGDRHPDFPTQKYTLSRFWEVDDGSGNTSVCIQTIVVCPEPIPTMGEWGLINLSIIMLILGVLFLKERHINQVKVLEQTKENLISGPN